MGAAAGAAGLAAAVAAVGVVAHRSRVIARRGAGDRTPFGSLHSTPLHVIADDARRPLHRGRRARPRPAPAGSPPTT